ncbi:hypothetical protein TNCV_2661811 [Trichonephila clavipes]|nr:hypothetical protein TNCV_2661811 [Trichonephila clavipes]
MPSELVDLLHPGLEMSLNRHCLGPYAEEGPWVPTQMYVPPIILKSKHNIAYVVKARVNNNPNQINVHALQSHKPAGPTAAF